MNKPYVHSNYERVADDNYKTIDPRCVQALVESFPIYKDDIIVDCCAPSGSKIVERLIAIGYKKSKGIADAFSDYDADWCITNPPYTKGLVDEILWRQISNINAARIDGLAVLLRNNFDFAKSRYEMFTHNFYSCQIHMMFRPLWVEEKKHEPIHNFVWHIWHRRQVFSEPIVRYWREKK